MAAGFSTVLSVAAGLAGGTLIGCNGVSAILAVPVLGGGAVLGLGVVPGAAVAAGAGPAIRTRQWAPPEP